MVAKENSRVDLYEKGVSLHRTNKLAEAQDCYRAFLRHDPSHAECLHLLGALLVQKYGKDQYDEALRLVKAAIQLAPANARYRRSLGIVYETAEQWPQAADAYERAIEKQPSDVLAHMHLAKVLKADDKLAHAAEAYKAVIRLQPDHPTAHYKLASVLKLLGKHEAAAHHYREQIRVDPNNNLAAFWAVALDGRAAPVAACPATLVKDLFDGYAENFDTHLVENLRYRTPGMLMESVWEASAALAGVRVSDDLKAATRWCRCVDLGCGTGLMGPLLRPHCGQLCGVDLSVGMLDKARQRGCYDDLAAGELVQYLQVAQQGGEDVLFYLLVAADVFVYIGDLFPVLEAAAAVAADRALFAFSTELLGTPAILQESAKSSSGGGGSDGGSSCNACGAGSSVEECQSVADTQEVQGSDVSGAGTCMTGSDAAQQPSGYVLQPTGRYAHTSAYIGEAAAAARWQIILVKEAIIRFNAGQPIWGNLCVLQRQ